MSDQDTYSNAIERCCLVARELVRVCKTWCRDHGGVSTIEVKAQNLLYSAADPPPFTQAGILTAGFAAHRTNHHQNSSLRERKTPHVETPQKRVSRKHDDSWHSKINWSQHSQHQGQRNSHKHAFTGRSEKTHTALRTPELGAPGHRNI